MEMVTKSFLDPAVPLVKAVAGWLLGDIRQAGRVRWVENAPSLAHLVVVVPTAQAGRSLRRTLAEGARDRGWCGLLPPQVVQPMRLIAARDASCRTATSVALRAAFLKFVSERPRRHMSERGVVLDEWPHLFQAEYILDYKTHLGFLDQLNDIWRILAGRGLLMRDVTADPKAAAVLATALGDETVRWQELAEFETAFFDFLHARGLRHEAEEIHLAKHDAKPFDEAIEEVVLPALADPVAVLYDVLAQQRTTLKRTVLVHDEPSAGDRYDDWGRPCVACWTGANRPDLAALREADLVRVATDAELARAVAADYPPADAARARPTLGLCENELYPELAAAFLNRGYVLHNPERHRIAASSLGRMLLQLVELYAARKGGLPWRPFAALMREDDILRTLTGGKQRPRRRDVLEGVDICRNTFLPTSVPSGCAFDETRVRSWERQAFSEFARAGRALEAMLCAAWAEPVTPAGFLRRMLRAVFDGRSLTGAEGEDEFRAAAEAVRDVLNAFDETCVTELRLNESATLGLLRKALSETAYALEPDDRHALKTEGWLELVWSAADKIALAGFHEGAVPDSVVGHPFVPDALRVALDLTSNVRRLARDTMLLCDLVRSRAATPGSVRAYVSQANGAGDIRRPSRLLFLVPDERLAERTRALFGDLPDSGMRPPRTREAAWQPRLPLDDVPLPGISPRYPEGRLSATALDDWLKCPFTYLLRYGLGMRRVQQKDELGADDFGTLIHRALELYALAQLERTKNGLAQLHEEADIVACLDDVLAQLQAGYGTAPTVKLRLQFAAAAGRLRCFAKLQARWAAEGWRIVEQPEYRFETRPFAGEADCDLPFKGSVDRLDYKDGVGYRIIDYKTWDLRSGAAGRILKGGPAECEHAERLHLPQLAPTTPKGGPKRFLSVQLLLYARCLEAAVPETFRGRIADCCYVLLGKNAENTVVLGSAFDQGPFEAQRTGKLVLLPHLSLALDTARAAIRRIRGNCFWPAGPGKYWKFEFRDVLQVSPEKDFPPGTPWRDAQEKRLEALT